MSSRSHFLPAAFAHAVQRLTVLSWVSRYWAVAAYCLLSATLVYWIGWESLTTRVITYRPGADYWEHAAALRALMANPWSPGNPHVVSEIGSPRYNPLFLLVALAARALAFDALGAMSLTACVNLGLFTLGAFWFFASYFRDRRAPLIAFFVLFMGWWKAWHFSNVYQLQILPSVAAYPSTSALALTWFCFALAVASLRAGARASTLLPLGLLCGVVLLVHPLTAMLTFSGLFALALFEPDSAWRVRGWVLLAIAVGALASHFWPYYSAFEVMSGGRHGTTAGWVARTAVVSANAERTEAFRLFYNVQNLQDALVFAAPGLPCALVLLLRRKHLFIPVGLLFTLGVFALNYRVPLPLAHRFILLAVVYMHIACVWGCLRFTPGYHDASPWLARRWLAWVAPLALCALVAFATQHNVALAHKRIQQGYKQRLSPVLNYARQVGTKAGEHAVVLARSEDGWPLPTFGPKVVSLLHVNPLLPDGLERRTDVERFFARNTSNAARRDILHKYGVTHVLLNPRDKDVSRFLQEQGDGQRLAAGFRLYTVSKN